MFFIKVYSIYDVKAKSFSLPFFAPNDQVAKRSFSDLVNDPSSQVSLHPEDYKLYYCADFDQQTCRISQSSALVGHLADGLDFSSKVLVV